MRCFYNHLFFRTYTNDVWWNNHTEQLEIPFLKTLNPQKNLPTQETLTTQYSSQKQFQDEIKYSDYFNTVHKLRQHR